MLAFNISMTGQQATVRLTGDLTASLVPDLQDALKQMLSSGVRELTFDLASTKMLDSSGIGLLIAASNGVAPEGTIRVTNTCHDIFRLLQSMRLATRLNATGRA